MTARPEDPQVYNTNLTKQCHGCARFASCMKARVYHCDDEWPLQLHPCGLQAALHAIGKSPVLYVLCPFSLTGLCLEHARFLVDQALASKALP